MSERGQASVALIATVPALIAVTLVLAQLVLAGHAALSAANAARAAARAAHVGGDPGELGRRALPGMLERGSRIEVEGGRVAVRVRVPRLLPFLPRIPLEVGAALGEPPGGADASRPLRGPAPRRPPRPPHPRHPGVV